MDFTVTTIGKFKVIKPSGRIDWESARLIDRELGRLSDDGFIHFVFNLDEVTFMCSAGIGALVYNLNRVTKVGGAIYIVADNEYIGYIFETLKFDLIFEGYMYKTYDEFSAAVLDTEKKGEQPAENLAGGG